MLKVGVIGVGTMGQHHVRLYSTMNCELVGVADTNSERAMFIGKKYSVPYFSNYLELLPKVDAVTIAVPTSVHHSITMDFLNNGIHCLVEKPIAMALDEAENMIEAAQRHKAWLAVGHIERFNPAVMKLKEIIDRGMLGTLLMMSTRRVGPYVPRIRDEGIVIDSATHDIGVVQYLIGKNPVNVYSRAGCLKHPNNKEDHALIVLDFEGATACIEVNWFTPRKVRTLVATGSEGIAHLDYIDQSVTLQNFFQVATVNVDKAEPLRLEIENFLFSVEANKKPLVAGEDGLDILKIALKSTDNVYVDKNRFETSEVLSLHR
jgi:UDP-N-acetylglucosamine 3-dehydrogenase